MSVRLDLTTITPELMDAVIYMDDSPAYDAFREEIEAILSDFNATGKLSSSWKIDEKDLTSKLEDTLKNMHRAYLVWSFREEQKNGVDPDCSILTLHKLFFKSQQSVIVRLNGGEDTVDSVDARSLVNSFLSEINVNREVYGSVKDFFKGYVYGYFFNYLKEAQIMRKYAEMLAYLGVMSNIISTTISEQQKVLPKMAMLLTNDRFKYLNGYVPKTLVLDIVFDRIEFATLSEGETALVKQRIIEYIEQYYSIQSEDGAELLSDDVTVTFASAFFGSYVNVPMLGDELYLKSSSGVRTFLDCDRYDTGDYSSSAITGLIGEKCAVDHNVFYTTRKEVCNDTALGGTDLCYKYPLVFTDDTDYWFAGVYQELVFPVLDTQIYVPADVPMGMFPFADEAMKTNCIREAAGIADSTVTVRKDRLAVLEQLKRLSEDGNMSERDRRMLCLEQMLCLVSGNCSEDKYKALIEQNVFETGLYEEYIRYRMDLLVERALTVGMDAKKLLLDDINRIS